MLSKHLFHFAMVHDQFSQTGDIIKGILPLFTPILSGKEGQDFNPKHFCNEVMQTYGIEMHPYVAESMAPKLAEAGALYLHQAGKRDEKYIIDHVPVIDNEHLDKQVSKIFDLFESFAIKLFDNANFSYKNINFSDEFSKRLARVDRLDEISDEEDSKDKGKSILNYAFARFVSKVEEKGGDFKDSLNKAYSGAILSEVVLSLKEPGLDVEKFPEKKFFIDAPILLDILGFNDEYSVECSRGLVEKIKSLGGILTTSKSYIEEAKVTIRSALDNYNNRGGRKTNLDLYLWRGGDNLLNARTTENNIAQILEREYGFNLEHSVVDLKGKLQSQKALSLKEKIYQSLHWYKNDVARDNDAEAIAFVVMDHGYCSVKNFAESRSFLITPNTSLIETSNAVLYKMDAFNKPEMTPLLSEKKLAMLLWIMNGGQGEDISSLTLIGSCARAMEMHKEVFHKIQKFLKKLNPEKIKLYESIICNDRAIYSLVDEVGASSSNIDEENFEDYLRNAKENYEIEQKELESERADALKKIKLEAEKEKELKERALKALTNISQSETSLKKDIVQKDSDREILYKVLDEKEKENESLSIKLDSLEKSMVQMQSALEKNKKDYEVGIEKVKEENDASKSIDKDKLISFFSFALYVLTSIVVAVFAYNASGLVIDKPFSTNYFTINPNLLNFIISIIPFLITWKLPDFILGKPIKLFSVKIVNYILR
ncbi:hypothetical protein [Marinomonas ostreistagni]|uniref:hypothetical protein n=1 Tax=Marinomonas ostreistagni TaxID=359209 RepID=UPI00195045D8|nr:hypothetical protein [Marinomonas ostreistagni]MBM6550147.1 hypothetical protein [Marinomonas ostreistagni]